MEKGFGFQLKLTSQKFFLQQKEKLTLQLFHRLILIFMQLKKDIIKNQSLQ